MSQRFRSVRSRRSSTPTRFVFAAEVKISGRSSCGPKDPGRYLRLKESPRLFDDPTPTAYRDHIIGDRFMRYLVACLLMTSIGCAATTTSSSSSLSAGDQLLTIDHYVRVRSTAPSMNGQTAQIYVRERVESRNIQRGSSGVVLFVHGAGTPAEVAFEVHSGDYHWMAY